MRKLWTMNELWILMYLGPDSQGITFVARKFEKSS